MNKWIATLVVAVVGLVGFSFNVASAAPGSLSISSFEAEYHLGRDSENHSALEVVEQITVEFPLNKNKGIVREIPSHYGGHSVSFKLDSITRNGAPEPIYSQRQQGKFHIIETGTDEYISGVQVFELKYSLRDVTKYFDDNKLDEFYWDVNGTGWRAPIERLSVRLTIDEELHSFLSGDAACYRGNYGSEERCSIDEGGGVFSASESDLGAGDNITIAVGFSPGTFAEFERSLQDKLLSAWTAVVAATSAAGVGVMIWFFVRAEKYKYRESELGTIVPEYLPPKNASLAVASAVTPGVHSTMAAELVDLAVRRYVQILETRPKSTWRAAEYDIKVVKDISDLRAEEQEILSDIFGKSPKVGDRLALKRLRNNSAVYTRFSDNDKKLRALMRSQYKLEQVDSSGRRWFGGAAKIVLLVGIVTLNPFLWVVALIAFIFSRTLWVLSDDGLALRRYLKGLEMYIKVAERDRLKMLQSPEGAEKVDIADPKDPAQLVKLYERVLPYAILFGQEKQWSKQLGEYYDSASSSPSWYVGSTAFNAAVFSSTMTSFSQSAAATSASSSTSGGSSGGGFSGGGGGGGGGGFR